jgi:iron-sulfur cluster assembly protein
MLSNPITILPQARQRIEETLKTKTIPAEYGLRVGIRGGGCGASWLLGFDLPGPTDEIYVIDDMRVIIDKKHLMYVLGAEVDYEPGGFTVTRSATP